MDIGVDVSWHKHWSCCYMAWALVWTLELLLVGVDIGVNIGVLVSWHGHW